MERGDTPFRIVLHDCKQKLSVHYTSPGGEQSLKDGGNFVSLFINTIDNTEGLPDNGKRSGKDMSTREINGVTIECTEGDIARQSDIDAVVNAANAQLRIGGGVAGAIHRAAGPGLSEECRPLAPIRPGEAVITGAHNLPNRHVIHCLGPIYGMDDPSDKLLAACYRNALRAAEENSVGSVAFPAISTGAFGYPLEAATKIALRTVFDMLPSLSSVDRIRFVLYGESDKNTYEQILDEFEKSDSGKAE